METKTEMDPLAEKTGTIHGGPRREPGNRRHSETMLEAARS